jgi:hypothetical protein
MRAAPASDEAGSRQNEFATIAAHAATKIAGAHG